MIYYLDTSAWIAWKFAQKGQEIFKKVSVGRDTIISSPLLVAEYFSFLKRIDGLEKARFQTELSFIRFVYPADPLFEHYARYDHGTFLKGADLYHLTTAIWFADGFAKELGFLSCDTSQRLAAKSVGFRVP